MFDAEFIESPEVDLFVAGFPCQPYSFAGKNLGISDHRGIVIFRLVEWISIKKPAMFLLENVAGLVTLHWDSFYEILVLLTEGLGNCYLVEWKVMDCREYGNIPQHKKRVFIIGILRARQSSPLVWPNRSQSQADVTEFLDSDSAQEEIRWPKQNTYRMNLRRAVEKIVNTTGLDPLKHHFFVDVGCSFKRTPSHLDCLGSVLETMTSSIQVQFEAVNCCYPRFPVSSYQGCMLGVCPCPTRSRAGSGGYWMTWKNRFMNTQEILRMMGVMNTDEMEGLVRPRSLRLIAGNAIPIPLVARVLRSMLNSISL